ncbi:P-loop containing nucleoside triphosphate hydrolase protein [Catenaria anguillulae PL171]|uniref:p-loop containing nucleoside triphosphate hydrolase protein n=1 Tax=Catenaria anguillulae PL171 TaxID=765915 RepID=A0A1Y2H8Q5_9FUNG|nr:P-loop containing nucleoside triphosphate hydrolase protein [Catenaria anguillulae PL171]
MESPLSPSRLHTLPTRIRASTLDASTSTSSLISPTSTFSTLGGFHHVKSQLTRHLLWPQPSNPYAAAYTRLHLTPTAGILLYGPPGTGKTLLASALAGECGLPFLSISVAQLVRGYVGESEKQVAKVFAQARAVGGGCVVFVDEVDAVFSGGVGGSELASKMVAQLVMELDTCASLSAASNGDGSTGAGRVVVVAATNHPWMLSEALVRPGRLDAHVYVGLPDERDRGEILRNLVANEGETMTGAEWIAEVARQTEGYSGADLKALVVRARAILVAATQDQAIQGSREQQELGIEWAVEQALSKVKPSVKPAEVERFERWMLLSRGTCRT